MNKSYRIIFNRRLCVFQIASELAKSEGKSKNQAEGQTLHSLVRSLKSIKRKVAITLTLSILFLPNAYATCTGAPGGSYLANAITDICTLTDGTYAGTVAIRAINGATINNTGDLNVIVRPGASARGVLTDSNSSMNLNNVTVSVVGASTGQFYGLQANSGTIIVNGDYNYTANGVGLMGIGAGSRPTNQGVLRIRGDATISINADSSGTSYGVYAALTGSVLTLEKKLAVTSAGTGSSATTLITAYGGYFDIGSIAHLNGDSNVFTMTGVNAVGLRLLTGATLNATKHLEITANANGGRGILIEGGTANLSGANTIRANNYGINVNAGGLANITGTSNITTTIGHGVYVTGANSNAVFDNADTNSTQITTTGSAANALLAELGGDISINNSKITSTGSSRPSILASGTGARINLNNASIVSNGAGIGSYGVLASSGPTGDHAQIELKNSNIIMGNSANSNESGKQRVAVAALRGGKVNVINNSIITYSQLAHGLSTNTLSTGMPPTSASDAEVTISNSSIKTYGERAFGAAAQREDGSSSVINISNSNIETSGVRAYGLWAGAGGVVNFSTGTITTTGIGTYGMYAQKYNAHVNSQLNVTDAAITTFGDSAHGGIVEESNIIRMEGTNSITTLGKFAHIFNVNGQLNVNQNTPLGKLTIKSINEEGDGFHIEGSNAIVNLAGTLDMHVNNFAFWINAGGKLMSTGASEIISGNTPNHTSTPILGAVYIQGANSTATFNNATTDSTQIISDASGRSGVFIRDGGTLNLTNGKISTVQQYSHGIIVDGVNSQLKLNTINKILTSGTFSYGISLQNGAIKTFDGQANNVLPTIKVTGLNSALLHATGNTSALALVNQTLDMSSTPNADTFGVKAENLGLITLDSTNSGGTGLWATNGNIIAKNTSDLSGSRVKLDNGGTMDVSAITISDVAIGSLESNDALSKITGGNKNLIIGQNNTTNNGSLIDNADFKGKFENFNQLIKKGNTTQILSGLGNTVGSVEVKNGTLRFIQDDGIVNQGTPFNVTGDYTTKVGATTAIGDNNSTLMIGGAFIQEASAIATKSTLEILLGASPDIQAKTAQLAGILNFTGFSASLNPTKASTIIAGARYEMIRTMDGITGSFAELDGVDYLISQGFTSANNKSYLLGFGFAWTEGGNADGTGSFTMAEGSALDVDIVLNDQSGTFASGWNGHDLTKNDEGELILSAQNGYTGSTTINGGTLYLAGASDISTSSNLALTGNTSRLSLSFLNANETQVKNLSGVIGSHVNVADKDLIVQNTIDTVFAGDFDVASGGLIKEGEYQLTLSGKTQYTGDTKINEGKLVLDGINGGAQLTSNVIGQTGALLSLQNGAILTGWIDPLDVEIDAQSTWNMTADSLIDNMNSSGNVNFVAPTTHDFKTLTVNGNWIGNNGFIRMNTALEDDASLTDKIIIKGDTSGTTKVAINNIGGTGAHTINGIQLIEVQGQSLGEFTQEGRIVAGAYDYSLGRSKINNKNWVLSSEFTNPVIPLAPLVPVINFPLQNEHKIRPEAGSYLANAAANSLFVSIERPNADRNYIDTSTGKIKSTSVWFTTKAGQTRSFDNSKQIKSNTDHQVMMLGGDMSFNTGDVGNLRLGAMAGYGHNSSDSRSVITSYRSEGSISGYGVGVYANWQQYPDDGAGAFIDGSVQYNWLKNKVKGGSIHSENYNSNGITATLATGYTFKIGGSDTVAYFLQPNAHVNFLGINTDEFRESNGTRVQMNDGDILQTKLGLRGLARIYSQDESTIWNISTEMSWINHSNEISVQLDDTKVSSKGVKNIAEIKLGLDAQFNKSISLWGNVGYQRGSNKFQDVSANVGINYQF